MDTVTAVLTSAAVLLGASVLLGWIACRSYQRNRRLYHRSQAGAALVAAFAVAWFPLTLAWWAVGPTPERRLLRG